MNLLLPAAASIETSVLSVPSPSQASIQTEDSDPDSKLFTADHKQGITHTDSQAASVEVASMESEDEDDEDDEIRITIGGKSVLLSDITEDMISRMTHEEHEAYTKAYHDAYEQYF